jgi:hypothetical protein
LDLNPALDMSPVDAAAMPHDPGKGFLEYHHSLTQGSNLVEQWSLKGDLLLKLQRYEDAEDCFEKAGHFADRTFRSTEEPIERLMSELLAVCGTSRWWMNDICTHGKVVRIRFEGARTADEFFDRNEFGTSANVVLDLRVLEDRPNQSEEKPLCALGLYPSGAIRSIRSAIFPSGRGITVRIDDYAAFLDPDAEQQTSNISSFEASMIIFAVEC